MSESRLNRQDARSTYYWAFVLASSAACVAAFFYRAVFTQETFVSRDIQLVYQPLRHYWASRLFRGEFPEWYPYDGLGQPFAGMLVSHAFHPTHLLSLVLPVEQAIELTIFLSFVAAMSGTVALCRQLSASRAAAVLGGVLFAFSGYLVTITNNLPYLLASSTAPWALWAALRFVVAPTLLRATGTAVLLSLVLFSGDPQAFLVTCALVGVLPLLRPQSDRPAVRRFTEYLGLMALTALFSAVQVVPSLHVALANGGGMHSTLNALSWSMHPLRLFEVALGPLFGGDGGLPHAEAISRQLLKTNNSTLWVDSVHVGLVGLGLAAVALAAARQDHRAWIAVLSFLGLLLLALGRYGGIYELLRVLPIWRPFRYPEKLVPFLALFLAAAAALGLDALRRSPPIRRRTARLYAILGITLFGAYLAQTMSGLFSELVISCFWEGPSSQEASKHLAARFAFALGASAVVCLAMAAILQFVRAWRSQAALICLLSFSHQLLANERFYELSLPEAISTPGTTAREIERREGPPRLGNPRVLSAIDNFYFEPHEGMGRVDYYAASNATGLMPVTHARFGLEGANCYLPAAAKRVVTMERQTRLWFSRYSGMFGARYVTVSGPFYQQIGGNAERVLLEQLDVGVLLLNNPTAMPRAYLTRPLCVSSAEESLAMVSAPRFPFDKLAVVECPPGAGVPIPSPNTSAPLGTVTIASYEPERVELLVDAGHPALLVLTDSYYSGWEARLDGVPADILPTNHAVRGIAVPPGSHRVVFTYKTPGLRLAAGLSLLSLVASVVIGLLLERLRPSHSNTPHTNR
jgi:hypothetical protein